MLPCTAASPFHRNAALGSWDPDDGDGVEKGEGADDQDGYNVWRGPSPGHRLFYLDETQKMCRERGIPIQPPFQRIGIR